MRPRRRWWLSPWALATAGLLVGLLDTSIATLIGLDLSIGEHDGTLVVALYLSLSFACLGYLIGALTSARDQERAAQAELAEQRAELARARAEAAHKEKLASLGQLAGTIGHEVRNPLAIIRSHVQNLEEGLAESDPDREESCRMVLDEIDRLTRVMNTLVDLVRPIELDRRRVEASEILDRTRALAEESVLAGRAVELLTKSDATNPIEVDRDMLCQVLLGLLDNAARHSPEPGTVHMLARPTETGIHISVTDQGPGVPEDLRDKIFDPFFTTRAGGSGLGLAVARQIIEAQGGRLDVSDAEGGGACFTVSLFARGAHNQEDRETGA